MTTKTKKMRVWILWTEWFSSTYSQHIMKSNKGKLGAKVVRMCTVYSFTCTL